MNRLLASSIFAATIAGIAPVAATTVSAVAVPGTLPNVTISEDVTFNFTGLGPSDGSGGTLVVDGVDLDLGNDPRETMSVSLDGVDLGQWVCDATPNPPLLAIPGASGANHCDFSLTLTIGGGELASVLSDGAASVLLAFGPFVNVNPTSQVTVTLSYVDATPIPLPASGLLLVAGLGGIAAMRRRTRAA